MRRDILDYAARNVPRYTSYPTAPHFTTDVGPANYAAWLEEVPSSATVSLYLHIPFCRAICRYCGCHTKAALRDEPISAYAGTLRRELDLVAPHLSGRRPLVHIHWGGGTPSILPESDFLGLVDRIHDLFAPAGRLEHAIELDPRAITPRLVEILRQAGVNRVNLGVQDFNPQVQLAIGRWQPYELVRDAVALLRDAGITRIGFDLMYGLPHQGEREIVLNAARAAGLWPDRIAVFGYAHVPWLKKHQRQIDSATLPGAAERIAQAARVDRVLRGAGYAPIGLDHFALPHDDLFAAVERRALRRNFQGYTADSADVLIGIGSSAIGRIPQGYVQNATDNATWRRAIEAGNLPTARGLHLDRDDMARADLIEQIMCFFEADVAAICARYGIGRSMVDECRQHLEPLRRDGIVRIDGNHIHIPTESRALARVVAAAFDAYLEPSATRHSTAV